MRPILVATVCFAVAIGALGCSDDTPGPATETKLLPAPAASGDGQVGRVGVVLAQNLRALVTQNRMPAQGVEVHWAAPGGGVILPAVSQTDASGIAVAAWTLPTTSGPATATATLGGALGSPVTYTATAQAGPATVFEVAFGNNQVIAVGTPAGEPLGAVFRDEYGNPANGAVNWFLESGSLELSVQTSDAGPGGIATVDITAGATPGTALIRAYPHSSLPSIDFDLTVVP